MAGSSKSKGKKQFLVVQNKNRGPSGSTEGRKVRSIAELHGVESLMVDAPALKEPLSPKSSIEVLQQQSREKIQLSEWLTIIKKNQS